MKISIVRRLSTFSKDISSEADSFHISYIASIGEVGERIIVFPFRSGIRTLVAMATYSSHRFIMGKAEIDNFFLSH